MIARELQTREGLADNRTRDVAANVEGIPAVTAGHGREDSSLGAKDEEVIVPLEAIDRDLLDILIGDRMSATEDVGGRDDEIVAELAAEQDEPVVTAAAVDSEVGVDVVLNDVVAGAAHGAGQLRHRLIDQRVAVLVG